MEPPTLPHEAEPTTGRPAVFFKSVLRSGLLAPDQLKEALRAVPADRQNNADAVADHLVKTGKLSRFQARKLLEGAVLGLVLGPYQILAPIGKGGMGTVYLARDNRNAQLVAVKVLPPKKARAEERLLARFRREMELCRRVSHPHLTRTYEVGEHLGVHYIAMEFIPGKNLYRLVNAEGPLAVARAARLFSEVALGLDHAHAQGLIHRDLKPSNLMVTPKDHAKVLDLGLALMQGELATDRLIVGGQGYVLGTMDYIAPEQAEDSSKVDARSDIYSLGCTLYFALTGRPPFPGGKTLRKLNRHRKEEPPPIEEFNPAVPAGFTALVRRMMAKRPEQRFDSAAATREALLAWVTGEPEMPLDRKEDREYQEAVEVLETTEPPAELEDAPILDLAEEESKPPAPAPATAARAPALPPQRLWLAQLALIGASLVFAAGLVAAAFWWVLSH